MRHFQRLQVVFITTLDFTFCAERKFYTALVSPIRTVPGRRALRGATSPPIGKTYSVPSSHSISFFLFQHLVFSLIHKDLAFIFLLETTTNGTYNQIKSPLQSRLVKICLILPRRVKSPRRHEPHFRHLQDCSITPCSRRRCPSLHADRPPARALLLPSHLASSDSTTSPP